MQTLPSASALIETLQLQPHVEGGYFRRTYQSDDSPKVTTAYGDRFSMTSIYYLLTEHSRIGHWHLNRSDIVHYFHLGSPITYYLIDAQGELSVVTMGSRPDLGEHIQLTVPGGTWKASHLASGSYGLISEAVSPGFDFADMRLGNGDDLAAQFPRHADVIREFSKE